ncbi:MAG TPA: hypothetical protein VKY44_01790 [Flavobacterium sp.]|nr:hypothetical protein [Flavobacterium sp.]
MTEIQSLISQKLLPLSFDTRFEELVPLLEQTSYSHLPVVENDIYMGSLAAIDVVPSQTQTVGDYRYSLLPYFVRKDSGWFEILEKFAQFDCNVLAVLNEKNHYTGYYLYENIFPFLNETPFLKETGLSIVVEKHYMDYSISEIAQIVETNNSKLLGIFLSELKNDRAQITIKASSGNINEIIQTFRRFGYDIVSEHNQDIYLNELKNRSAYLDKYLNI